MDWREMSSRPTVHGLHGQDHRGWDAFTGAYSGGKKIGVGSLLGEASAGMWDGRVDSRRGWCIAFAWLLASLVEYVQRFLVCHSTDLQCLYVVG
jgi:protein SYS1